MNELPIARLSLTRAADLTPKSRRWLSEWLKQKAKEIAAGECEEFAPRFRATLWSGRGIGWRTKPTGRQ